METKAKLEKMRGKKLATEKRDKVCRAQQVGVRACVRGHRENETNLEDEAPGHSQHLPEHARMDSMAKPELRRGNRGRGRGGGGEVLKTFHACFAP